MSASDDVALRIRPRARGGPFGLLTLFSSVRFGITLLAILFVYSSVGSAGIVYPTGWNLLDVPDGWVHAQLRQWRPFEMTEFEWFHWWPFDLLIGLICLNMATVTVRRIRLDVVNLGVWMIHTGIIVLALGSLIYFATKVEGDAPVVRRQVQVRLPSGEQGAFEAIPGNALALGRGDERFEFRVVAAQPDYALRSEGHEGETTYAVSVDVRGPDLAFQRQLLAGYPEFTEDVLPSGRPEQPMVRAVKELGRPLVDEQLELRLAYRPSEYFYLANWVQKSWALYLREKGTAEWIQRPVEGLPLYNDYIRSSADVWLPDGESLPLDPIDVVVPAADPQDPLGDEPLYVTGYLRYARFEGRRVPGKELAPWVAFRFDDGHGRVFDYDLLAVGHHDNKAEDGFFELFWAGTPEERETLPAAHAPRLAFSVPGTDVRVLAEVEDVTLRTPDLPFLPIPGTDYEYRVEFVEEFHEPDLHASMASVELRSPERHYRRWVFDDPRLNKDVSVASGEGLIPDALLPTDPGLRVAFRPAREAAPVAIVAGPGERDLGLVLALGSPQDGRYHPVEVGELFSLGRGTTLEVRELLARSKSEERPAIVPSSRRVRDVREESSMVQVRVPMAGSVWVPFHRYAFRDPNDTLRRYAFSYDPTEVRVGGRTIEIILGRQRLRLPDPVVLDDFSVTSHVGGFTGRVPSILNWTSQVRFVTDEGLTEPVPVSVNNPAEHGGLWYFQAFWDPAQGPRFAGDVPSQGLNYTVLGVGNRKGVGIQLLGCAIAVVGMLYAFYVKPQIRRRRRHAADAAAAPAQALEVHQS